MNIVSGAFEAWPRALLIVPAGGRGHGGRGKLWLTKSLHVECRDTHKVSFTLCEREVGREGGWVGEEGGREGGREGGWVGEEGGREGERGREREAWLYGSTAK